MADAVAASIAFAQAAEMCVRMGRGLLHRYQAYKQSDDRVRDLILQTEGIWFRTTVQFQILLEVTSELSHDHIAHYNQCLRSLERKLEAARSAIDKIIGEDATAISLETMPVHLNKRGRTLYSVVEKHLVDTVHVLETWYTKQFDPAFLLLIRSSSQKVDAVLNEVVSDNSPAIVKTVQDIRAVLKQIELQSPTQETVFRPASILLAERIPVPNSNLMTTKLSTNNPSEVLLDTTTYPISVDKAQVKEHVRDLTRILLRASPATLGLLRCLGVLDLPDAKNGAPQFQIIYSIPDGLHEPKTLRTLLSQPSVSLDVKFVFARAVARGVATVHNAGFVHKNIRPETILMLEDKTSSVPQMYLVGFENFRAANAASTLADDMFWYRNIYRHPAVQGRSTEERYSMQHDIYSLGVCLLELGLWHSFVVKTEPPRTGKLLDISHELELKNKRKVAIDIKTKLVELAKQCLPAQMGDVFTELVVACLTCLDSGERNSFAEEATVYDKDGILVGVAFIEKVLLKLGTVSF